jgi:TolB-like protein
MNLFNELKRRNVFRAAGLYIVVGWALAQAAALLENALSLPAWFDALVISLLALGFPIAVIFSWAYEMTPEGLKPTKDVSADASIAVSTGAKLDKAILAGIVVLIAVIAGDRFIGRKDASVITVSGKGDVLADNSIAVLPFADMSAERDQEYFSDGISEELLNVLAGVKDLRVAGRTSSFAFKGQNKDLKEIGEILDVGHIVEGSIRKQGDRIRVTAQLVQTKDGYRQWSNTYDRDLNDIFAVQDEIARAIVAEMSAALPALAAAPAELKPAARAEFGAYERFLLAREKMTQEGSKEAYESAVALLDEALKEDPNYAPALAWRAYGEVMLSNAPGTVGTKPVAEGLPIIKAYVDRALAADGASADTLFALGAYHGQLFVHEGPQHLDKSIETLRQAVAIRPNFPQAQNDLAYFLDKKGEDAEVLRILEEVLRNDPGLRDANNIYINRLMTLGRHEEAEAALARWSRIGRDKAEIEAVRGRVLAARGRLAEAWRILEPLQSTDALLARVTVRQALGDGDWIAANAAEPRRKALGAAMAGDFKRAIALVDNDPAARAGTVGALAFYVPVHSYAGDAAGAAAYYDAELKTPAAAIAAHKACSCSPLRLAVALRDVQHKDYPAFLAAMKADEEQKRATHEKSPGWNAQMGAIAALEGDAEAASAWYNKAMDYGARSGFFQERFFGTVLPDDPRMDALLERMRGLLDAERASLGLPPLALPKG